ncbi:GreA/GreB family elongation factor [Deinococcus sp. Marseille-Q6407]|uniref:GreA/GreB family elongation factor n=1 Tax=Deinococcus sp. Marseille-Q6407 TaxID=2969223 RepID=UPI0021BE971B|nr:GreA/GreB family elongation factor [Deinococcus sp. Marseille-Q6407]
MDITPFGHDIFCQAIAQCEHQLEQMTLDLSDNLIRDMSDGGPTTLRHEQDRLRERVEELKQLHTQGVVRYPKTSDTTELGSNVSLQNESKTIHILLLSPEEFAAKPRHLSAVSTASPIGQALLGSHVGDQLKTPCRYTL